jgi:small-conductance mechanosensitive channel
VVNRSRGWSRLAIDVPIAADQDLDRVLMECEKVASAMNNDAVWRTRLLDPVEVWGVEGLAGGEALVRLVVRAKPGGDAPEAARELRRRLVRSLLAARVRTAANREIVVRPGPAPGSDPAPSPATSD